MCIRDRVWSELGRGTNFVLTLPRQGVVGDGALGSPIPVDPGEDGAALDDIGLTQPIAVPSAAASEASSTASSSTASSTETAGRS